MIHEMFPVGMLQMNCSVLGDEKTREGFVVDPGDEADRIAEVVQRHQLSITRIVLTHAHIDHIGSVRELQEKTGAPVSLHPGDRPMVDGAAAQAAMLGLPAPPDFTIDEELSDGDTLWLGSIEIRILHTPGHSPGGCCLWIPSETLLVAGDTLFQGSIGRSDLPGGDHETLLESIRAKLLPLPDNTIVVPGHGPATTIGRERQFNPFLSGLDQRRGPA